MRLENLATRASQVALNVGHRAERPSMAGILMRQKRRRRTTALASLVVLAGVVYAGAQLYDGQGQVPPAATPASTTTSIAASTSTLPTSTTTTMSVTTTTPAPVTVSREECPVTLPGNVPFTPAAEKPEPPPSESYAASWFGTPRLWTFVYDEGQVWEGLPTATDGTLTQKTFWWNEDFTDSTVLPDIRVTMESIGGSGDTITFGAPGSSGGNAEWRVFMIVGLSIPYEGCWRVTAEYEGDSLSYVTWVEGR